MGRVFNTLVQLLAVRGVLDTQCGFKAMRYAMVTGFDVELLFLAQKAGSMPPKIPGCSSRI
jgi:hypothetical protein